MTHKFEAKASASGDELDIQMYGVIGSSWFEEGITAQMVSRALRENPRAKTVRVRINSPGGLVDEGMTIKNILEQHPADVHAHIEGAASSAASIIAMGAKRVLMHEGTTMMVHEASTVTRGDTRAHERAVGALAAWNDGISDIYATRTRRPKAEMRQLMAAETWLTPAKAIELGFADEVVKGRSRSAQAMAFDLAKYGYQNIPPEWANQHTLEALRVVAQAKETEDMNYQRIAIALGLAEGSDEDAILKRIDSQKTAHARDRAVVAELCELTGKDAAIEALGVARAYAGDHDKLEETQKQLAETNKLFEDQEREAVFAADAADPKGRKLTPATREFWKGEPVAKLKAYMEKAAYVVTNVAPRTQPGSRPTADGAPTDTTTTAANGGAKKYVDMTFLERHQLKRADPERHRAMKAEAEAAGEI